MRLRIIAIDIELLLTQVALPMFNREQLPVAFKAAFLKVAFSPLAFLIKYRNPALWILSGLGFISFVIYSATVIALDGGMAADALAYIRAGQRVAAGEDLYQPLQGLGDAAAYRYAPGFAQLWAPLAGLPELATAWGYRVVCFLCLYYLVGSWRAVGISLLFPPLAIEMMTLNVTMPMAAIARWSLRSSGGAGALAAATYVKQSVITLFPYIWITQPARRKSLSIGIAVIVALVVVHAILDPGVHLAYLDSLQAQSQSPNEGGQLLRLLPSTLGDFVLRLALALSLMVLAIYKRWDWLAFTAAMLAVPTFWLARLAPLVAVPRLWQEDQKTPK